MPLSAYCRLGKRKQRKYVGPLLEMVAVKTGKPGRPPKKLRRIAADKGYDSDALRDFLKSRGIQPQILRKKNAGRRRGRTACQYERSAIPSRKNFFMAPEKIPAARCPLGKTTKMFRCFSLLSCLFFVGAAIIGIGLYLGVTQLDLQLVDFVQRAVYAAKIQLAVIIELQISTA